jgi:GH25 family lysozyme M1 (1,4-beta-N-acetylmuramidase)
MSDIDYGCLLTYRKRDGNSNITKYAILDHPLCEFKSFDTRDQAEDYLDDLNHALYKAGIDYSEYDQSEENNINSSKNTYADVVSVLNGIISSISKDHLKEDRWKRINNQN